MQLLIAIICMALVANLQYGWTLFVTPMSAKHGWSRADIQVAFSIFILVETWFVPVEGWIVDHYGPRPVVATGAVLAALAWALNSVAGSLPVLYLGAVFGGLGAGCVYGTCVGNALKLFPDKRGLAAGLTAAGFGAGAALTVIPIARMIHVSGYEHTFMFFGIAQGVGIFLLSMLLVRRKAPKGLVIPKSAMASRINTPPQKMLKTPVFWVMYAIFVAVSTGGIMTTAQIAPIAHDFGLSNLPMTLFGLTLPLLTMTLSIDSLANGFTRPLSGYLSDLIGRENVMFIIFTCEGLAMLGLMYFGHNPYGFLIFAPLIFLCWGEIFSIFPAISGDTFGPQFATVNNGLLYTAKGTSSLLVPLASLLAVGGRWDRVFVTAAFMAIVAALCAKFVLFPMRKRWIEGQTSMAGGTGAALPVGAHILLPEQHGE
jgi:OFA family oxalate/formate antiporter-like MFS transporter